MSGMDLSGLDKLRRNIQRLSDEQYAGGGSVSVPLAELMPDAFVRANTDFGTLQEMLDAGASERADQGGEGDENATARLLASPEWSAFVAARSRFDGWEAMQRAAAAEHIKRQIFGT